MTRSTEKDLELSFDGQCSDYEGSYGHFTVRVPLTVVYEGGKARIVSGKPEIEWNQKGGYAPSVSFDDYSSCSEAKE